MSEKYINIEALRIERLKKKITLRNMAKLLGFKSAASYYNIEKGKIYPKINVMIDISKILEKPVDYFFYQENSTKMNK